MPRFQLGLKLHSTNIDLIPEAIGLWERNVFQYIELYVIPGSYDATHEKWKDCRIPFVLHAAHSYDGINLASRIQWQENRDRFCEVHHFADLLNVHDIIIHGGMNGSIEELIEQARQLGDSRLLLENKPQIAIRGEICVGSSPEEVRTALEAGVLNGFVLDFGHAECAAVSMKIDPLEMVKEFIVLRPKFYHLSDGLSQSERDTHLNFGRGDRQLADFVRLIHPGAHVTIETPRDSNGLKDFLSDCDYLKSLF